MDEIVNQLMKMKSKIEEAKLQKARLEGELSNLHKQLKTDFSCKTDAEGQRKLSKMEKDIAQAETSLEKAVAKLQDKYQWD